MTDPINAPLQREPGCARCGYPQKEHSHSGACYGLCGEFVPAPKAEASDRGHFEDHLSALRDANAGAAVTVWKDGSWQAWQTLDAKYAEGDSNWLCTIPFNDAIGDAFDIVRATAIAAVRREATSAERERCTAIADEDAQLGRDDVGDRGINQTAVGARILAAERIAFNIRQPDYLAANKPQDITPARDHEDTPAEIALGILLPISHNNEIVAGTNSVELLHKIRDAIKQARVPAPARDPVALLLAEAERLRAVPYVDTEFYTDHQERQRRARCYQDAAELLEKGPR